MVLLKGIVKKILPLALCYTAIFTLIFGSKGVSTGVKQGIETCLTLVIPSLFIFMVLGNIIVNSKLSTTIATPISPLCKRVFGLNAGLMSIVLVSLVGGYPIGARMLYSKVTRGEISPDTASHMLCYCVNCGPAFLISGVGANILGNAKIGIIIYFSQMIACFIIVLIKRGKVSNVRTHKPTYQTGSTLLINAVSDSVRAMSTVCGLIVCFSVIIALIGNVFGGFAPLVNGLFEVTSSIQSLASLPYSVVLIAVFTAFGGICVHMQIAAMLKGSGVLLSGFLCYRLLYSAISGGIVWIWLLLFPQPLNCFSVATQLKPLQAVSPVATVFLILLSIMLLFFSKKFDRI